MLEALILAPRPTNETSRTLSAISGVGGELRAEARRRRSWVTLTLRFAFFVSRDVSSSRKEQRSNFKCRIFLHCLGVAFCPILRLLISASSQPTILRRCVTLASLLFRLGCFLVAAKVHFTLLATSSAPAYTRQLSRQWDRSPFWYSSTIKSSTALISLCDTIVPLQEGLPLLLRSPSSQASTVLSTERNSLRSVSELLSSSSPVNALSALCPPSSSLSYADPDASGVRCFRGLPGLRIRTSGVDTPGVVAATSVRAHVRVRRGSSEPSPRTSALPEPVLMADLPGEEARSLPG